MTAVRALLSRSIDYAGLFPPAGLAMPAAVEAYASYRGSDAAWALGRFVVPASRLGELESAAAPHLASRPDGTPWNLSVLLGTDPAADIRAIGEFNCRHAAAGAGAVVADAVEGRAATVADADALLARMPGWVRPYVEIPADADPAPMVAAIAARGGRAKIRTGGVTEDAFPSTAEVVRFIAACVAAGVPFKATAGLHHPLRAEYPLTYAADAPRGTMFGFLNVFLAAAFLAEGLDRDAASRLLEESSPGALALTAEAIAWHGRRLSEAAIANARDRVVVSFGSCSFTEPIGDLAALGLL